MVDAQNWVTNCSTPTPYEKGGSACALPPPRWTTPPSYLLGNFVDRSDQGDLPALHLVDEDRAALDLAVGLELDRLGDALEAGRLDPVVDAVSRGLARLDGLQEDLRGVVALGRVRARVGVRGRLVVGHEL